MTLKSLLAALLAALLLTPAPAAVPKAAGHPAPRDWSQAATLLPGGTYLRGNPAAKVKLVEYFSFTCPHCAAFSVESAEPMAAYLKSGKVSLEYRHALRDAIDLGASLLARCAGPRGYAPTVAEMLARQQDWGAKLDAYESANVDKLKAMDGGAAIALVMRGSGLAGIAVSHGLPAARVDPCLKDMAQQKLLASQAQEAWGTRKIPGTPAFLLNGALLGETASWAQLKPKLDAALR